MMADFKILNWLKNSLINDFLLFFFNLFLLSRLLSCYNSCKATHRVSRTLVLAEILSLRYMTCLSSLLLVKGRLSDWYFASVVIQQRSLLRWCLLNKKRFIHSFRLMISLTYGRRLSANWISCWLLERLMIIDSPQNLALVDFGSLHDKVILTRLVIRVVWAVTLALIIIWTSIMMSPPRLALLLLHLIDQQSL
jgi:hypothetical protein